MREIKRVQSFESLSRTTGMPTGPNDLYRVRPRSLFLRAADLRVAKIPAEYRAKARAADSRFVGGGSGRISNALNAMPEVKGIAFGVLGEFSSSVNVLIEGPSWLLLFFSSSRSPSLSAQLSSFRIYQLSSGSLSVFLQALD